MDKFWNFMTNVEIWSHACKNVGRSLIDWGKISQHLLKVRMCFLMRQKRPISGSDPIPTSMFVPKMGRYIYIYKLQNEYWWYYSKDWKMQLIGWEGQKVNVQACLWTTLDHTPKHLDFHKSYLNHTIFKFHELKLHLPSTWTIHFGEFCVLGVIWFVCMLGQFYLKIAHAPITPSGGSLEKNVGTTCDKM